MDTKMGRVMDTKRIGELSQLIGERASRLEADRKILAEMSGGKVQISVSIGNRSINVVNYVHPNSYTAIRGREMFDLAARKMMAGFIDIGEAELHKLQAQLAAAMRGES